MGGDDNTEKAENRGDRSTLHFGVGPSDKGLDFGEGGHAGVAWGGHGEGPMGSAEVQCFLWISRCEEAVDQSRHEAVACTNAVEDIKAGVVAAAVELALMPSQRAPVVDVGGVDAAQGGGDGFQIGVLAGEL